MDMCCPCFRNNIFSRNVVSIYLKKGRDKPVRTGHPWIFSAPLPAWKALTPARARELPRPAKHVRYCPTATRPRQRLLQPASRFVFGCSRRQGPISVNDLKLRSRPRLRTSASRSLKPNDERIRLVNSEGDFLPGLIVDRVAAKACASRSLPREWNGFATILSIICNRRYCQATFHDGRTPTPARARVSGPKEGLLSATCPNRRWSWKTVCALRRPGAGPKDRPFPGPALQPQTSRDLRKKRPP